MRRFNSAIQGRPESSFDYPATTKRPLTSDVQDSKALRSSRQHDHDSRRCYVNFFLALVMGCLVVVILWTKHESQMKSKKQSFIFPVYACAFNVSWRDGVPDNNPFSISRSSHRRSLLEESELPNYISEVRPALKHIVYQIKLDVKGKVFLTALDSGSFATWLFCNYHSSHGINEHFYTPTSENFITPERFQQELQEAYIDSRAYLTFRECGPELPKDKDSSEKENEGNDAEPKKLAHICFKINYDKWGHVTAALVEDNVLILDSKAAPMNVKFGCGFNFDDSMATASYGILGLGNMPISVPKQLADTGLIDRVVGICFSYGIYQVDYDQQHTNVDPVGYLVLGQPSDYDVGYQWIPMGEKPAGCRFDVIYFVYIQMNKFKYSIKKNDDKLIGGTLIDIGATYMSLVPLLYHQILDVDKMDVPFQNRIVHQYVIAFAIREEIVDGNEASLNVIGGLALRGNKLIIDNVKQRIGLSPEYKCAMPDPDTKE